MSFRQKFSLWLLKLFGWKVVQHAPIPKKCVVIAVPHTSNWDFPKGFPLRSAVGAPDIGYVGKASLFKWPYGWFMKWLGGVPVDRSKRNNFVDAVVDIFNEREQFRICIAPEGTRRKVDKLKSGFYYIALGAKVPVQMVAFDYKTRTFTWAEPFMPSGDYEADLQIIDDFYRGTEGKNPEWSYLYGE